MNVENIRPKVVVICGPTAAGKTALGVILAEQYGGEVVSADSMQVYRRMDIGTAKPTRAEMRDIPHHMIDVVEPQESFSVSRYVEMASACIDGILERGRLPIIVGGTGLYIDALVRGLDFPQNGGGEVRERLSREYDERGGEAMLSRLFVFDPERAALLHPNDKKRVTRALEVYELTGQSITEHDELTKTQAPRYESCRIALAFKDRESLYRRIERRVDKMLEAGLEAEVDALLLGGASEDATAMQAIGYKELARVKSGRVTRSEAVETIKRESRRYAKRQLTWLRRDKSLNWIYWDDEPDFDFARRITTKILLSFGIE